jgi:hypothetical protein
MAENSPSPAGAAHAWNEARLWRSLALVALPERCGDGNDDTKQIAI